MTYDRWKTTNPADEELGPEPSGASQDAQDRTDRFMAKVEAELTSLPPTERLPWLQRQRKLWIIMFNRFVYRADEGLAPEFGAPAEDYELTITALGQRIALEERRLAVVPVA